MCVFRVFSYNDVIPGDGIFYDFAANVREFITFINIKLKIKLKNELDPKLRTRLIQNIFLMVDKKFKNGNSYKFSDVWSKIRPVYTLEFDSKTKAVITRRFNEICNAFCLDSIKPNVGLICETIDRCYQQYGEFYYGRFFEVFHAIKEEENPKMQYENEKQNENKVETESKEVSSEETTENEKLNEEKSNVIDQFKFQIFDLRNKSFSTQEYKFSDFASRFDNSLYFKNLKGFVRNVFFCRLYNENTVLKNICEEIYPERELKTFVRPSCYDEIPYDELADINFKMDIEILKEWHKRTLIVKKQLTSNFNKLYKTFYKDRWEILENLDEIFDPIINEYEKDQENEINENESKEVSSEETNNNNDKDQENETNDIESTIEHFAETFNHFINGETFIRDSGTCRRSGRYLPLLEVFGSKYVRALEPLIRERMRLPEDKGISRVVDGLNLDQNLLFEKLNGHYLRYTPGASLKCAETRFLEAKRNVTKLFNRLCYFSFDIYVERSEVIEKIRENLETIINAIAACVEDSRYNKFEYDFMDLFRYYYKKEINNKRSNNESKEVSSERTNNKNDKDQENENEDNNTVENPWLFIIKNAKLPEVEV